MKKIFTLCSLLIAGAAFATADEIIVEINGKRVENNSTVTVNTLEQKIFDAEHPDWGWEKFQVEPEECLMKVISDNGGTLTSRLDYVSNDVNGTMVQCCGKFFGNCYSVASTNPTSGDITFALSAGENDLNAFLAGSKNGLQLEWQLASLPSEGWENSIKPGDKAEAKFTFNTGSASLTFNVVFVFPNLNNSVEGIEAAENGAFDVYSLDGSVVRRNATDLNGLDKGIYIANGKKVLVK